jgi:hypothetical protein
VAKPSILPKGRIAHSKGKRSKLLSAEKQKKVAKKRKAVFSPTVYVEIGWLK